MSWTEERIEIVRRMWAEGASASKIARALGGVSRNAVIGKVHRLGLPGHVRMAHPKPRPARGRTPRNDIARTRLRQAWTPQAGFAAEPAASASPDVGALNIPFLESKEGQCRWITSADEARPVLCCGLPTVGATSWCAGHDRIVFDRRPRAEPKRPPVCQGLAA